MAALDHTLHQESAPQTKSQEQINLWPVEALPPPPEGLYGPLKSWQTRVMRLHPAHSAQEVLRADILRAGLADGQHLALGMDEELITYECISYTWASTSHELVPVIFNGLAWRITPTLGSALKHFRLHDRPRYLWADLVCINQTDKQEKSRQVANMSRIFGKATKVLVWLGDEAQHTADAVNFVQKVAGKLDNTRTAKPPEINATQVDEDLATWEVHRIIPRVPIILGLLDLCSRRWLRRVWIRQEVFFARSLSVHCGDTELSLDLFQSCGRLLKASLQRRDSEVALATLDRSVAKFCRDFLEPLSHLSQASEVDISSLATERRAMQAGGRPWRTYWQSDDPINRNMDPRQSFEFILLQAQFMDATDDRDYIYALLNMTNCPSLADGVSAPRTPRALGIAVDYSASASDVFQRATKFIVNRDQDLAILRSLLGFDRRCETSSWPSWCIDWRQELYPNWSKAVPVQPFRALWQDPNAHGILHVRGVVLATVEDLTWEDGLRSFSRFSKFLMTCQSHVIYQNGLATVRGSQVLGVNLTYEAVPQTAIYDDFTHGDDGILRELQSGDTVVWLEGLIECITYLRPTARGRYALLGVADLDNFLRYHVHVDRHEWKLSEDTVGDREVRTLGEGFHCYMGSLSRRVYGAQKQTCKLFRGAMAIAKRDFKIE